MIHEPSAWFVLLDWCDFPSVLWCCRLGLLTGKTHYRVGEPTAAWQFADIRQHWSFDNGRQYVSCGHRQPPLSGAPVNKWLSTIMRERQIPPDSESGGFPHLFGTSLSPHIGSAWRARHDNNNNKIDVTLTVMHFGWVRGRVYATGKKSFSDFFIETLHLE